MTFEEQARALVAVKLLTAIRRTRPQLYAAIQEFAKHEFPALAAVSQKEQYQLVHQAAGLAHTNQETGNKPPVREKVA